MFCASVLIPLGFSASPPKVAGQQVQKNKQHNFARWEKNIAAFEEVDRTAPPPKDAVLFVGASTITLWKSLARDFPDHKVINRGFGGSEIVDTTHFAERIIFPYAPKMIILRCGSNDISNGKRPEDVLEDFRAFVGKVREKLPKTEIVFMSLNAIPSRLGAKGQGRCSQQAHPGSDSKDVSGALPRYQRHGAHGRRQVSNRIVRAGQAAFQ